MRVVEYPLYIGDRLHMTLPRGAEVLDVGTRNGVVLLWALVDLAAPNTEMIEYCCVGTGSDWPDGFRHLGTVEPSYGVVWHVGAKSQP